MNSVNLFGHLGKDPETKQTDSGLSVTRASLATSADVKDGDKWVPKTTWHRLVVFGPRAEAFGKFLKKGAPVLIQGRIDNYSYEKDGETKYFTDIVVENFHFVGVRQQDSDDAKVAESQASDAAPTSRTNHAPSGDPLPPKPDMNAELPF